MLDEIARVAARLTYDFRETANPDDPLKDSWPEWVPYYRLKAAIAAALRPATICEIGVRFGYSAAAFLHGAPDARYVGIDLDVATFGGVEGALSWARRILPADRCELHVADTQRTQRLPGGVYDLVHVDGQQDGDGTWHDLDLSAAQGRWVLLDGYFWTRQNMLAATEWLRANRLAVEWFGVIPGHAGELLVKMRAMPAASTVGVVTRSADLAASYTAEYYRADCGGYDAFQRHGGKRLDDLRLRAVAALGAVATGGRMLDLGCGRGELTYHFARSGFEVTAVDFSPDATVLARSCFAGEEHLLERVTFVSGDVNRVALKGRYDLVVAADLVEHLMPDEVARLYERVSAHLAPGGHLIVHTFPNYWFYCWSYPRLRRQAAAAGAWLPPDPRTPYERMLHINEQSPRVLRAQLSRVFPAVQLWFADATHPAGTLGRRARLAEARTLRDLFAVASHAPLDPARLRALLTMAPFPLDAPAAVTVRCMAAPVSAVARREFTVEVAVENRAATTITSFPPHPVHLSYHWRRDGASTEQWDGRRSPLLPPLPPDRSAAYRMTVEAPPQPGRWHLELSLVQEGLLWFEQAPGFVAPSVPLLITETAPS